MGLRNRGWHWQWWFGEVTAPSARKAPVDYSSLNVPQLKAVLDEREVVYPSNAKKQELIDLLEG